MPFTPLLVSQTDSGSPCDQLLFDTIREDLDFLYANQVTNGDAHNHDGGDGGTGIPNASLELFVAGDYIMDDYPDTVGTTSSTYVKTREWIVGRGGVIRVKYTLTHTYSGGSGGTAYAQIYVNGVAVGLEKSFFYSGPGAVTTIEDIVLNDGDLLQIYQKCSGGTNPNSQVYNVFLYTGNTPSVLRHKDY